MPPEKDETPLLAFIKEEKDEEEHSNRLINPLIDEEDFVIRMIEEMENESNIWINTKQGLYSPPPFLAESVLRFLFLHTLFFFELYFEHYLIGTTIS